MKITKELLLEDLKVAYILACKGKKKKPYVQEFQQNEENNLLELRDDLWDRTYQPQPSSCFIIEDPKKREVFAAAFRDRIVHHLYYNYTHVLFENTFIHDSYSCIQGRGTHFGVKRLKKHIRQESENYTEECYALKMDISGYFMHINRQLLCEIAKDALNKMKDHQVTKNEEYTWDDVLDYDFIFYLTEQISLLDPSIDCVLKIDEKAWIGLPLSKSLFYVEEGCGLPIGNLTSQLFSNVYLNKLDQYVKQELGCKHYGRYVDDFYIISKDKNFLHKIITLIKSFLKEELHLDINQGKTRIMDVEYGVEFLGAFVKPFRTYIATQSLNRIKKRIFANDFKYREHIENSINSYLGILGHYKSWKIRTKMFNELGWLKELGVFNKDYTKFKLFESIKLERLFQ